MSKSNTASGITPLRDPQFRSKLVIDQLIGPPTITNYQLKKLAGKETGEGVRHLYTPSDVRRAKLAQLGILDADKPIVRPKIINTRMAKGGTGKTTVSANVATALAFMGYKVLCVDGDPQASLTNLLGVDSMSDNEIRHVGVLMQEFHAHEKDSRLKGKVDIRSAAIPVFPDGMLDLIPADITMTMLDSWLMGVIQRETLFDRMIDANLDFFGQYDVIVIDSAPGTSLLSYNLMAACETILAVVWLDRESLKAVNLLSSNVMEINGIPGKDLDIEIVANGFHQSYKHCKDAIMTLAESYPGSINENVIAHYTGFTRQQTLHAAESKGALVEQDPFSPGAKVIFDLAKSLLGRYQIMLAGSPETLIPHFRMGAVDTSAAAKVAPKDREKAAKQPVRRAKKVEETA